MGERRKIQAGWLTFFLLVVMLLSVVWSLQAAAWAPGLDLLNWVVLLGAVFGLLVSRSRLPGFLAHLLASFVGVIWITWLALRFFPQFETWQEQLDQLRERVFLWTEAALSGGVSADNLIFILEMSLLLWFISYSGVWYLFRNNSIWSVLVPSGATILVNTYYAQQGLTFQLIVYLVCAFLLIIRSYLRDQEEEWLANGVAYNPDLALDFLRDGTIFAVVIIVLAWLAPAVVEHRQFNPVLARFSGPLGEAQRTWSRLFASLNYRPAAASSSWFGGSMTFQGPLRLSDELVMEVRANGARYWRAEVLDTYSSAGWTATDTRTISLDGPTPTIPGFSQSTNELRSQVVQNYTIFLPAGNLLFASAQPIQVSIPARLRLAGPARGYDNATETAMSQLYSQTPVYSGQSYRVTSAVSRADEQSLRAAGTDYPEYIRDHYTSLPPTLPDRVVDLAKTLTEGLDNPYDQAKAIESYLRTFRYDVNIPGPRPGEDGVDYFLFREKAGYCDYYAASMAVMLRAIGVPTRLARGYSQGERNPEREGSFLVRQRDAHTWVEVYFPKYGWIEFEPTAAQPVIERPAAPPDASETTESASPPTELPDEGLSQLDRMELETLRQLEGAEAFQFFRRQLQPRTLALPLGMLASIGLAGGAVALILKRRWRMLTLVERIFDQLAMVARILGVSQRPMQTPREYAEEIGNRVPTTREGLTRLALIFSRVRFSPHPLDPSEEEEASTIWQSIRLALLRSALAQRIQHLPRRPEFPKRKN